MSLEFPVLYSFRRCPYAMRARMALLNAGVVYEHREVDLKNKPQAMLKLSPKGTVPVLQLTDSKILEQSLDIMMWAFKLSSLSGEDHALITENDTTFKEALNRYKYPDRYPDDHPQDVLSQCHKFLSKINERLHPFIGGKEWGLVDMALFPFIRQCRSVDEAWFDAQAYDNLKNFLNHITNTPLFEKVMAQYSPWQTGDKPLIVGQEK